MQNNCDNTCSPCGAVGVVISIILAAVTGIVFANGLLPTITTAVWIAFGLAVFSLATLIAGGYLSSLTRCAKCICKNGTCLLVGAVGTIVAAIIALSITIAVTSTAVIVLIALGAFFFFLMLIALASYIYCLVKNSCKE